MDMLKWAITLLVALIGVALGLYYFRANRRRNSVTIDVTTRQIMATKDVGSDLQVSYGGAKLGDPYLVVLKVANIGPKDVRSKDFDQDLPLRVHLGRSVVSIIKDERAESGSGVAVTASGESLEVAPTLLSKGRQHTITAVVDGHPSVKVEAHLADTDVSVTSDLKRSDTSRHWFATKVIIPTVAILLATGSLLSVLILNSDSRPKPMTQDDLRQAISESSQQFADAIETQNEAIDRLTEQIQQQSPTPVP